MSDDVRTVVTFHAHPDDEAIATGGTIARAAAEGHRVVLVVATMGENGEVADGFLAPDERLEHAREREVMAAADALGIARVEFLGYRDSGMMGTAENDDPRSFWRADVEEAAARLGAILEGESADVLTVYDDHGGYGHPDHIQVHRVGHRAASLAGVRRVYEATMNRDRMRLAVERASAIGLDIGPPERDEALDGIGSLDSEITTSIDVRAYLEAKRRAMTAHASQIGEDSWFLSMPDEVFTFMFGFEFFIRTSPSFEGDAVRDRETWLW